MNTEQMKKRLEAHEQELLGNMRRLGEDARDAQSTDVQDPIDYVESSENKALNFRVDTIASNELRQVQDALQRINDGSYGTCIDCGRPIPEARLEAVPWTPYCVEDQEKHDQEAKETPVDQDSLRISSE